MAFKALIFLVVVAFCSVSPTGKAIDDNPFDNELFPYPRIVGGTGAGHGERPEIVAIRTRMLVNTFVCGGSLLTPRTVLTAAHCNLAIESSLKNNRAHISVGNIFHADGLEYRCSSFLNHPDYHLSTIKSDIGLLYTRDPVVLTDLVKTVVLHQPVLQGGEAADFFGWGTGATGGPSSIVLKKLSTTIITNEECVELRDFASQFYPGFLPHIDGSVEICSFHSPGNGACHGDSGSPLVLSNTNRQVGIVSWGIPCARGGPDVFCRISSFVDWVEEHLLL